MQDGIRPAHRPYRVRAKSIFHPAPALAYRIEADGRSLVYATDTEDPFSGKRTRSSLLRKARTRSSTTRSSWGATFKATWATPRSESAIEVAARAKVKRLVLFHHDPDRNDDALDHIGRDAQHAGHERLAAWKVLVAREGLELEV